MAGGERRDAAAGVTAGMHMRDGALAAAADRPVRAAGVIGVPAAGLPRPLVPGASSGCSPSIAFPATCRTTKECYA